MKLIYSLKKKASCLSKRKILIISAIGIKFILFKTIKINAVEDSFYYLNKSNISKIAFGVRLSSAGITIGSTVLAQLNISRNLGIQKKLYLIAAISNCIGLIATRVENSITPIENIKISTLK